MDSHSIEVAALGRPLFPGTLYDCREDSFIPGVTLWDEKSLRENLTTRPQPQTDFKLTSSDSFSSNSLLMDVSASLKASFLGGWWRWEDLLSTCMTPNPQTNSPELQCITVRPQDMKNSLWLSWERSPTLRCLTRKLQLMWSQLYCTELRLSWCLIGHFQRMTMRRHTSSSPLC